MEIKIIKKRDFFFGNIFYDMYGFAENEFSNLTWIRIGRIYLKVYDEKVRSLFRQRCTVRLDKIILNKLSKILSHLEKKYNR